MKNLLLSIITLCCISCSNKQENKIVWDFYQIIDHSNENDTIQGEKRHVVFDVKIINPADKKILAPNIGNTHIHINNEELSLRRGQVFGYFRNKEISYINPCDSLFFRFVLFTDDLKKHNISPQTHPSKLLEALTLSFDKGILVEEINKNPIIIHR